MQCKGACLKFGKTNGHTCVSPPYGCENGSKEHILYKMTEPLAWRTRNKSYQQATLLSSIEEIEQNMSQQGAKPSGENGETGFINPDRFAKASMDDKLSTLMQSLNKLHQKLDNINDDLHSEKEGEEGVFPRLKQLEEYSDTTMDNVAVLKFEVGIMHGMIYRQEQQIMDLKGKVIDLTARQMADNLTITSLIPPKKDEEPEDCLAVVTEFFQKEMELDVKDTDILVAHRLETTDSNKVPLVIIRCHPHFRNIVLNNTKILKDKLNAEEKPFYINKQVPEEFIAKRKENSHTIKKLIDSNKSKPQGQKARYPIKKRNLFINDTPVSKPVAPPSFAELFADKPEQEKMNKIKLCYVEPVEEKGSIFTVIAAKVSNITEVKRVYRRVKQLHSHATHIPMAYDCQRKQNCQDDSEHSAGLCLQKLIEQQGVTNKVVFVVRSYRDKRLGAKRFQIFEKTAKEALAKNEIKSVSFKAKVDNFRD